MISLRKHIDSFRAEPPGQTGQGEPALDAFRASLLAIGELSERAVPALGSELNTRLTEIAAKTDRAKLPRAADQMRAELETWADRALQHHNENEREIREIIGTVAGAAESIGEKSDKYAKEIGYLNIKLRSIAEMNDVAAMRRSIVESTQALKTCVERMTEENRASVVRLSGEVRDYRKRLEESERVSSADPLTGLANRRAFERQLAARIAAAHPFCLILLDMNGFKQVNDTHGHLAGDDILRQFAAELKNQFSPADTVARWGGDEFAVVLTSPAVELEERVGRIRRWVFGEYKIAAVTPPVKVECRASIGAVEWDGRESPSDLIARADRELYAAKPATSRSSRAPAAKSP